MTKEHKTIPFILSSTMPDDHSTVKRHPNRVINVWQGKKINGKKTSKLGISLFPQKTIGKGSIKIHSELAWIQSRTSQGTQVFSKKKNKELGLTKIQPIQI